MTWPCPKGEFWHRLERALDLSRNILDQAKRDFGNSPSWMYYILNRNRKRSHMLWFFTWQYSLPYGTKAIKLGRPCVFDSVLDLPIWSSLFSPRTSPKGRVAPVPVTHGREGGIACVVWASIPFFLTPVSAQVVLDRKPRFFGQKFEIRSTKYETMTKILMSQWQKYRISNVLVWVIL